MDNFDEDWKEFNDIKQELYFDPNLSYLFHKMASRAWGNLNFLSQIMLSDQPAPNLRYHVHVDNRASDLWWATYIASARCSFQQNGLWGPKQLKSSRFQPLYHDMDTFNEDWKEFNDIKQ